MTSNHSILHKYKKAMFCNGEPKTCWADLLPIYVSGTGMCFEISDILDDYDIVRANLLKSLGDTPLHASHKW